MNEIECINKFMAMIYVYKEGFHAKNVWSPLGGHRPVAIGTPVWAVFAKIVFPTYSSINCILYHGSDFSEKLREQSCILVDRMTKFSDWANYLVPPKTSAERSGG